MHMGYATCVTKGRARDDGDFTPRNSWAIRSARIRRIPLHKWGRDQV